jgi:rare lipoprotein A
MRLPVNQIWPLAALALLSACGGHGEHPRDRLPPRSANGPAADYPVVVGEPFDVGDVTYTPVDRMNFDAVGYAAIGADGGEGVSAAHKTLPLPSYVEVTSLDSGKTILVRVERRGPMSNDRLIELSPGAASQLGLTGDKAPVRVRRVNPPEQERAMLRSGQRAPERMETPKALLAVLLRKIDPQAPVLLSGGAPTPPVKPGQPPKRPLPPKSAAKPATITPQPVIAAASQAAKPAAAVAGAATGSFVVQVGAFSSRANADATAAKVGGRVEPAGRLFRVRSGPFAIRAEADAALAKARSAGYSDARIQRAN